MHFHAFHDSCLRLQYSPLQPELVYRSDAPSLAYLHNNRLLGRTRNTVNFNKRPSIVNTIVPFNIQPLNGLTTPTLVAPFGHNHNQLEVIGIGGQNLRPTSTDKYSQSLDQCFKDVLRAQHPNIDFCPSNETTTSSSKTFTMSSSACYTQDPLPRYSDSFFRFKRLAEMYPRNFKVDPIVEVLVDDKMLHAPFIYAYNGHGIMMAQLHIDGSEETGVFPMVKPTIISDLSLAGYESIATMFVSPHDYGIMGMVTLQRQFVIWDATVSIPTHKVNIFHSSNSRIATTTRNDLGCLATETIDCGTFSDRPDCCLLGSDKLYLVDLRSRGIGQIFPSPFRPRYSPCDYFIPRFKSGSTQPDNFSAIAKHPTSHCLYAIASTVNNSLLLWDIRRPSSIIEELPLPLIRQGRGRYRSIAWYHIGNRLSSMSSLYLLSAYCWDYHQVTVNTLSVHDSSAVFDMSYNKIFRTLPQRFETNTDNKDDEKNINFKNMEGIPKDIPEVSLSERSNAGDQEVVRLSPSMTPIDNDGDEDSILNDLNDDVDDTEHLRYVDAEENESVGRASDVQEMFEPENNNDIQESDTNDETIKLTEFWTNYNNESQSSGYSPFFVNPFLAFKAPTEFNLPVCDVTGLCFSSSRPPPQIVIYKQIQLPIGVTTISNENRYFVPLGPLLSSNDVLMNEGLNAPLCEAALSQLFTGFLGLAFVTLDVPMDTYASVKSSYYDTITYQRTTLALALTTSGRMLSFILDIKPKKRVGMLKSGIEDEFSEAVFSGYSPHPKNELLLKELLTTIDHIPRDACCQLLGPVPHSRILMECLKGCIDEKSDTEIITKEKKNHRIGWNSLSQKTVEDLMRIFYEDSIIGNRKSKQCVFGKRFIYMLKASSYTSIHGFLRCNDDLLVHPAFAMSNAINFERIKLETIPFWRHPELDSMYWSEALMDLLVGTPSLAKEMPQAGPQFVESISWRREASSAVRDHRDSETVGCIPVAGSGTTRNEAPSMLTLAELLEEWDGCGAVDRNICELKNSVMNGKALHWVASTGGLDKEDTSELPYSVIFSGPQRTSNNMDQLFWHPIPDKAAIAICSCVALKKQKPLCFGSEDQSPSEHQFHVPLPKDGPVLLTPVTDGLERTLIDRKKRRRLNSRTHFQLSLRDPSVELVSSSIVNQLLALPISKGAHEVEDAVGINCDLIHKFCSMKDFHVYKKLDHHDKNVTSSSNTEVERKEKQSVVTTREYPSYYSQLKGVRVTSKLYESLQKEWNIPAVVSNNSNIPSGKVFGDVCQKTPTTSTKLIENCSFTASSSFGLPFYASVEFNEQEAANRERRQKRVFGVLSSQMTQDSNASQNAVSFRRSIASFENTPVGAASSSIVRHLLSQQAVRARPLQEHQAPLPNNSSSVSRPRPSFTEPLNLDLPNEERKNEGTRRAKSANSNALSEMSELFDTSSL